MSNDDECTICFEDRDYICPELCENNNCSKFICVSCMNLIIDQDTVYFCPFCRYCNIINQEILDYLNNKTKRKKKKTDIMELISNLNPILIKLILQYI